MRTDREVRRAHRAGHACAARIWCCAEMPTSARVAPTLARRILGVGTYIIATEPLGEERVRVAVAEQRRHRRHQLDPGLFPPLGRSPVAVRRPRQLQRASAAAAGRVHAQAHAADLPGARRRQGGLCLGRLPRHHHEPRAGFRAARAECVLHAGILGHGMSLTGLAGKLVAEAVAGTAERFDVFARIPHRDFPGGPLLQAALAGDRDAVLPAARSAVSARSLLFEARLFLAESRRPTSGRYRARSPNSGPRHAIRPAADSTSRSPDRRP